MRQLPRFFFAPGGRPQPDDVDVALAVGQTTFLVPGCAPAADLLADHADPRIAVALDSHIFEPRRPPLDAYAEAIAAWWHMPGRLSFAIAYDHLGNPERSLRDYDRLCNALERLGVPTSSGVVVPVLHRGHEVADVLGADSIEWDDIPLDEMEPRDPLPALAIGGLAFAQYHATATSWLATQLHALNRRPEGGAHLLGLTRPDVVLRRGVSSFDSSRPARQAAFGWPAIAPSYDPRFGLGEDLLKNRRSARLAYWLTQTRARIGLPYHRVAAGDLSPDRCCRR